MSELVSQWPGSIASCKISSTNENILKHTVGWVATSAIVEHQCICHCNKITLECASMSLITFYKGESGDGQTRCLSLIRLFIRKSARCCSSLAFDSSQVIPLADCWGQMTSQSLPATHPHHSHEPRLLGHLSDLASCSSNLLIPLAVFTLPQRVSKLMIVRNCNWNCN